ncbi:MAG: hypothetical protein SOX77_06565 [Candidatus Borkfalkiaceae bacterium]|nr:hypothetical protein [Christensenellaceae bacterium]
MTRQDSTPTGAFVATYQRHQTDRIELVKNIEETAKYCGCQFVIATHSPFLLAIENAKIYNLDTTPITLSKWWELENPKIYFEFFNKHKDLFLKETD